MIVCNLCDTERGKWLSWLITCQMANDKKPLTEREKELYVKAFDDGFHSLRVAIKTGRIKISDVIK
jgi:hypothetical protein